MSLPLQKRKRFSNTDIYDLINAIEERPGIWQKPASYRTRKLLLNEIAEELKCNTGDIYLQWNSLIESYNRERGRIMKAKKKIGIECRSNWQYYTPLQFLYRFSNNITKNMKDMDNENEDIDPTEIIHRKLVPISETNRPARTDDKFFKSKFFILNNALGDDLKLPKSARSIRRAIRDSNQNNFQVSVQPNKIFGDFVTQEIDDLNNDTQLKAKIEIQEILQKYSIKSNEFVHNDLNDVGVCNNKSMIEDISSYNEANGDKVMEKRKKTNTSKNITPNVTTSLCNNAEPDYNTWIKSDKTSLEIGKINNVKSIDKIKKVKENNDLHDGDFLLTKHSKCDKKMVNNLGMKRSTKFFHMNETEQIITPNPKPSTTSYFSISHN